MELLTRRIENHTPRKWGLAKDEVEKLSERLHRFWERYQNCFRTKTRDVSRHAKTYLQGLLLMNNGRNFSNIERRIINPSGDGQNIQQFISASPWKAKMVLEQIQHEIAHTPGLEEGGILILDESAEEKAGGKSAGAGRQYNGRLGKIEMSQVGVFVAFYKGPVWTWIDGELFLPEKWFSPEMEEDRRQAEIPVEREFATKVELGWKILERIQSRGLSFDAVACDDLYGRSGWFRRQMDRAGMVYMAEIPENTLVSLSKPERELSGSDLEGSGRRASRPQGLGKEEAMQVRRLANRPDTPFRRFLVRSTERGDLEDPFAMIPVWTIRDGEVAEEWLIIRQEDAQRFSYALSNAPHDTPLERLAQWKCARHFVERSNQDAKSEIGWDEFQARKYPAWEHHLALTIMATWFIAQTKLEWSTKCARDESLQTQFEMNAMPNLSVANVRELLQAVMPLPNLSPVQAMDLVVDHLVNRARSTRSRRRHLSKRERRAG